jgi:steroid delta-isomerase-like uncharacterized protein
VTTGSTTQLDPAFVEQFKQRFFEAWNAIDGAALAALCTEDIVWNEPLWLRPACGRQEVRDYVQATKVAFPDFHVEPLGEPRISATEPVVLHRYHLTGTMRGPWRYTKLRATGKWIEAPAVDEWTFRGELMCHYRTYYDTLDTCRQLGILPPVYSPADRLLTRATNLRTRLTRTKT